MLEYNEIRPRKFIVWQDEPYEVIDSHVFRKQQRKPVNQTKLKNLITGKVIEQAFHQSEKVNEAEIPSREVRFLYTNKGEYWFCEKDNSAKRFELPANLVADKMIYVRQNDLVGILSFDDQPIGVSIPIKVKLKVKEAAPAVRGNTAQGATKQIVLETGAVINSPLFVNEGDIVEINTETGEYASRM
ncbi:MAG: elongation factor [Patescibacteria group bacterium]|nr:elongation factor [Patescibacteria group bacterium]